MRVRRIAVVGGGIIGTAVARQLTRAVDGAEITLYEKENRLAAHQTGHNSGVVHAGLYYPPGSLKARLCRRGVELLRAFAAEQSVAYQECGKIVVAQNAVELDRLTALHRRAVANGVPDVRLVDAEELRAIEPHAAGLAALHSPHTAIVDFVAVTEALAAQVRAAGGRIRLATEVRAVQDTGREARVTTDDGRQHAADLVITCAGLQSDRLAASAGDGRFPRIIPFFGDYFLLRPAKRELVRGLIYPVPDPRYPFLGVHLTRRVDGEILVGPNAFLALHRESYRRRAIGAADIRDAVGFGGFWRFAARNLPAAARETRTALSSSAFVDAAARYLPGLTRDDVTRGPRGIRAQAMTAEGGLVDDFVITGSTRIVHVRNAPSPGATSALAIAEHIVAEAIARTGLGSPPP